MIVHFEGLDLAGKSTVCRLFRENAPGNWNIRHNTMVEDNPIYELADRLRRDATNGDAMVGWLYHAALLYDLEKYVPPSDDIIQDSLILLRSLAFHSAIGTRGLTDQLELIIDHHPRFDHTFVLVADHQTRLARLAKRRKQHLGPEDFLVLNDPERFYIMQKLLIDYAIKHFGAVIIDSSGELDASCLDNIFTHIPGMVRT
ncbi:MAG: hypothetical protein R3B84_14075 [Zavarzinella sp.]